MLLSAFEVGFLSSKHDLIFWNISSGLVSKREHMYLTPRTSSTDYAFSTYFLSEILEIWTPCYRKPFPVVPDFSLRLSI